MRISDSILLARLPRVIVCLALQAVVLVAVGAQQLGRVVVVLEDVGAIGRWTSVEVGASVHG